MKLFNSFLIILAVAFAYACGSSEEAQTAATDTSPTTETEWVDTPADGKLLFSSTVKTGSESVQILLMSKDDVLGTKFVAAMMGVYDIEYETKCNGYALFSPTEGIKKCYGTYVPTNVEKKFDLTLRAKIKISNLDYNEDGTIVSEINCPETDLHFGSIEYAKIPTSIELPVAKDIKLSCPASDDKSSFYVSITGSETAGSTESYKLKFNFEQRNFFGKIHVKENTESSVLYGKDLYF